MCEAMIPVRPGIYGRCWGRPVETHHMLTRARGGAILDRIKETYHLIDLCPKCHRNADGADAYGGGLLIDGYVTMKEGKPYYQGSDPYLRQKYGDDDPWEPGTGTVKNGRAHE
jgi:hypothetical protein